MPTRNVVLTDRQADLVTSLVDSGRYQNASEVIRHGLRLVEQEQAEDAARLQALRDAVAVGIAEIEAGRYREFASTETLRQYLSTVADEAIAAAPPYSDGDG